MSTDLSSVSQPGFSSVNSTKNKEAEAHANNVLLRASVNENGQLEKPTPEKILKCLNEEIASIQQQPEEDSFASSQQLVGATYSFRRPTTNDLKTAGLVLDLLLELDSKMKDLVGYNTKDLINWAYSKLKDKFAQQKAPIENITEEAPKAQEVAAEDIPNKLDVAA